MRHQIIFAFFIFINIGQIQAQDTTYFDKDWNTTVKPLATFYKVDLKSPTGWDRTYHYVENDLLLIIGSYSSIDPDVRNGQFKYYYTNGKLQSSGKYVNNELNGTHYHYYENGKLKIVENFRDGEICGNYREYYPDGSPSLETNYLKGKMHGSTVYFEENGYRQSSGDFVEGNKEGIWTFYYHNEQVKEFHNYQLKYNIYEGNFNVKLPNNAWRLEEIKNKGFFVQYIFKRDTIYNAEGEFAIPDIHIFIENAKKFKNDIKSFSMIKREFFKEKGAEILEELSDEKEEYPLPFPNGIFIKSSHVLGEEKHALYMIHFINNKKNGVQIYLDSPENLGESYKEEFFEFIRSIKLRRRIHFF